MTRRRRRSYNDAGMDPASFLDFRHIDIYCERTDPSLWSEPLNAASNAAFFVAAVLGWRWAARVRDAGGRSWDLRLLAALAALVGCASLAFHILAQVWSAWADGLAILAFIYAYLARYLARVAKLQWPGIVVGLAAYAALDALAGRTIPKAALNGSGMYLAALLSLAALAAYARSRSSAAAPWLLAAAGTFLISLGFRTVDLGVCDAWPPGTHFLWHLLNGTVLALAMRALAAAALRAPGRVATA
jgi:hypothetical protein